MNLNDLLKHTSEWLKSTGPNSDIVMSSRVRLARNIDKLAFPSWANEKQSQKVLELVTEAVAKIDYFKNASLFKLAEVDSLDKQFLIERHLMSHEHAQKTDSKALVLEPEEIMSIMVNEEDHLRMQIMQSGLNLFEAWNIMSKIDDQLSDTLTFAFSQNWGYLTACPTNTGTGMRGSVMLHLPALVATRQINRVLQAVAKLSFTTRGLYGEGTQASGNFFQISNQISLGHSEEMIIENINGLIRQIIDQETQSRNALLTNNRAFLEDKVWRSYGTLENAYIINSEETIELLSMVRLGVDTGIIKNIDRCAVNELFILTQPAHLQKMVGKKISSEERDVKRAEIIREKLKIKQ
ncbi:MAG: protein arginine kinase [Candidatus Omnitrophica bacterium]|nr:protein arginine kinase [Candidatus Omnitrophota bacterium]MDD5610118.1 protein arginine kinase [Candidatus Omnitrophota bacterium]